MTYGIDSLKLPSVLFESLADLPEITAVYFALAESGEVLYVGTPATYANVGRVVTVGTFYKYLNVPKSYGLPAITKSRPS
jgi:hypothetical protein